ncbi:hypothetical protein RHP51_17175 [Thalassobellus suaedae]|uniref:Uncharacterized protein n=1 Tax=Thalassobellus suaedae TaxID=3074124 RepID=A0ABY9XS73_9FLAO|nr:hypothetical protein RHP51_17175 [Flavobacteriaceae bacterium HL-DH14]
MKILKFKNNVTIEMKSSVFSLQSSVWFTFVFCLITLSSFSQVTSAIDSTSIKIGEQITYHIQVETDTTSLVVFPESTNHFHL